MKQNNTFFNFKYILCLLRILSHYYLQNFQDMHFHPSTLLSVYLNTKKFITFLHNVANKWLRGKFKLTSLAHEI